MFLRANCARFQFGKLYTAPAALGDFCDSSGCLPGQVCLIIHVPRCCVWTVWCVDCMRGWKMARVAE